MKIDISIYQLHTISEYKRRNNKEPKNYVPVVDKTLGLIILVDPPIGYLGIEVEYVLQVLQFNERYLIGYLTYDGTMSNSTAPGKHVYKWHAYAGDAYPPARPFSTRIEAETYLFHNHTKYTKKYKSPVITQLF